MTDGFAGRVPAPAPVSAPAKVNLYLHVGAARADGRHSLDSLVVFTDDRACDWLTIEPAASTHLTVGGDTAADTGATQDNLVLRALSALEAHLDRPLPHRIHLEKGLPVAAGLGGGSSDAGALLRTIGPGQGVSEPHLLDLASPIGGDVPACVLARACRMTGDGDTVAPVAGLPPLPALVVNPRLACPTGPVFRAFDDDPPGPGVSSAPLPDFGTMDAPSVIDWFAGATRNDLGPPAIRLVPAIAGVLETLSTLSGAQLVRMSGSGASCFALFATPAEAVAAHDELVRIQPDWWARAVLLG